VRLTDAFPIVISGPSGAGKTTIVKRILSEGTMLKGSISATTRPSRPDEVDGESYLFVSQEEFETLKAGKLIEWASVHGHLYGTPRKLVDEQLASGHDIVLNIDVQGGASVKKAFPNAVLIFILTPSSEVLEERIRRRATDLSGEIEKRLENAWGEIRRAGGYDYIVVNDQLDDTVATLLAIIRSERHRRGRYPDEFIKRFDPRT
jgi:guanylate kinase